MVKITQAFVTIIIYTYTRTHAIKFNALYQTFCLNTDAYAAIL